MSKTPNNNPLQISMPFKVVGIIILVLLFTFGLMDGIGATQRSLQSQEYTGVISAKNQTSPGGGSGATYTVDATGGQQYTVEDSARSHEVGDTVTVWAAPGDNKADFQKSFSFEALRGFTFAIGAVLVPILVWQVNMRSVRKPAK